MSSAGQVTVLGIGIGIRLGRLVGSFALVMGSIFLIANIVRLV